MRDTKDAIEQLRARMINSNKSLTTLAEKSSLTKTTVDKVQTGKTENIFLSTFLSLCDALDLLPAEVFDGSQGDGRGLSGDEMKLLDAFRALNDDEKRDALIQFLKAFGK